LNLISPCFREAFTVAVISFYKNLVVASRLQGLVQQQRLQRPPKVHQPMTSSPRQRQRVQQQRLQQVVVQEKKEVLEPHKGQELQKGQVPTISSELQVPQAHVVHEGKDAHQSFVTPVMSGLDCQSACISDPAGGLVLQKVETALEPLGGLEFKKSDNQENEDVQVGKNIQVPFDSDPVETSGLRDNQVTQNNQENLVNQADDITAAISGVLEESACLIPPPPLVRNAVPRDPPIISEETAHGNPVESQAPKKMQTHEFKEVKRVNGIRPGCFDFEGFERSVDAQRNMRQQILDAVQLANPGIKLNWRTMTKAVPALKSLEKLSFIAFSVHYSRGPDEISSTILTHLSRIKPKNSNQFGL
jgi:hypothetical protein